MRDKGDYWCVCVGDGVGVFFGGEEGAHSNECVGGM